MDDSELNSHIVAHLSQADNPNDLILEICEQTGRTWPEAEALVRRIQEKHQAEITVRQSPLLMVMALGIFIGGLVLTAYGIYPLVVVLLALPGEGLDGLLASKDFFLVVHSMVQTGITPFAAVFVGVGMILGSLVGMRQVWVAIIERVGPHK